MITIPAEFIIANYFGELENTSKLEISNLSKIKRMIDREFAGNDTILSVDISWESIADAVNSNPKYFSFDDSKAAIIFDSSQREIFYQDLRGIFNAKVDRSVRSELLSSLEDILSELII